MKMALVNLVPQDYTLVLQDDVNVSRVPWVMKHRMIERPVRSVQQENILLMGLRVNHVNLDTRPKKLVLPLVSLVLSDMEILLIHLSVPLVPQDHPLNQEKSVRHVVREKSPMKEGLVILVRLGMVILDRLILVILVLLVRVLWKEVFVRGVRKVRSLKLVNLVKLVLLVMNPMTPKLDVLLVLKARTPRMEKLVCLVLPVKSMPPQDHPIVLAVWRDRLRMRVEPSVFFVKLDTPLSKAVNVFSVYQDLLQ